MAIFSRWLGQKHLHPVKSSPADPACQRLREPTALSLAPSLRKKALSQEEVKVINTGTNPPNV